MPAPRTVWPHVKCQDAEATGYEAAEDWLWDGIPWTISQESPLPIRHEIERFGSRTIYHVQGHGLLSQNLEPTPGPNFKALNSLLLFRNMGTKCTYYVPSCAGGGTFQTATSGELWRVSPERNGLGSTRPGGHMELRLRPRQMNVSGGRGSSRSLKGY